MKSIMALALMAMMLLLTAVMTTQALAMSSEISNETKSIIVGAVLPFAGDQADIGFEEKNAIEMALNDTGRKFKVIYADSASLTPTGIDAFNKLVNVDNIPIVITSLSWVSNGISPLAAEKGILQFAVAAATFNRTEGEKAVLFTESANEMSKSGTLPSTIR